MTTARGVHDNRARQARFAVSGVTNFHPGPRGADIPAPAFGFAFDFDFFGPTQSLGCPILARFVRKGGIPRHQIPWDSLPYFTDLSS